MWKTYPMWCNMLWQFNLRLAISPEKLWESLGVEYPYPWISAPKQLGLQQEKNGDWSTSGKKGPWLNKHTMSCNWRNLLGSKCPLSMVVFWGLHKLRKKAPYAVEKWVQSLWLTLTTPCERRWSSWQPVKISGLSSWGSKHQSTSWGKHIRRLKTWLSYTCASGCLRLRYYFSATMYYTTSSFGSQPLNFKGTSLLRMLFNGNWKQPGARFEMIWAHSSLFSCSLKTCYRLKIPNVLLSNCFPRQ